MFPNTNHNIQQFIYYTLKKCWVKYNLVLGEIGTNPAIGLFWPNGWVKYFKYFTKCSFIGNDTH